MAQMSLFLVFYQILFSQARGFWVGIRFDEPVGKSDGSNRGVEYFKADMKYAAFVRGDKVEVGDFPEDFDFSDSDEEL